MMCAPLSHHCFLSKLYLKSQLSGFYKHEDWVSWPCGWHCCYVLCGSNLTEIMAALIEVLHGFPQFFQENAGIVP